MNGKEVRGKRTAVAEADGLNVVLTRKMPEGLVVRAPSSSIDASNDLKREEQIHVHWW
jgi:hypothetical protein